MVLPYHLANFVENLADLDRSIFIRLDLVSNKLAAMAVNSTGVTNMHRGVYVPNGFLM